MRYGQMHAALEKIYTQDDYYALPEDVHAELINGRLYDQAAPSRIHQKISSELYTIINNYIKSKNGRCEAYYAPFAVDLSRDGKNSIVEPDISVICDKRKLTDRGCTGAPDWIIEIVSPSNPIHDYVRKLNLYLDAGVREYWIVNPMEQTIYVYSFGDTFRPASYKFSDKIKAGIYDNLTIDFASLDF